jgi:tRNA1(Val) A37 N6-methylase TrmN6
MTKYSQPDFYKFSQDSTTLANLVIARGARGPLLDLCCGCGVIGIEIAQKCEVKELYLLELQEEYRQHILNNLKYFIPNNKSKVLISNYLDVELEQKFNTIVVNPPYFNRTRSRRSPDERKDLCRSYDSGDIKSLVLQGLSYLEEDGDLYMVLRDNEALLEVEDACEGKARLERVEKLGENLFLRITHLNKD